jgi:hypothetical protein
MAGAASAAGIEAHLAAADAVMALDGILDAFHEAGHVAAYLHFAQPFEFVVLHPQPFVRGLERFHSPLVQATLCVSGPIAEAKYSKRSIYDVLANSGRHDAAMANDALRSYRMEQVARIIEACGRSPSMDMALDAARIIVDQRWRDVCRLSAALLRYERLSSDEVLQVIGRPDPGILTTRVVKAEPLSDNPASLRGEYADAVMEGTGGRRRGNQSANIDDR